MTCDEVVKGLREIDWLVAALAAPVGADEEDLDHLRWLLARRRFLADLLAVRRAQKGKKVVSLDVWREGRLGTSGQKYLAI